MKIHAEIIDDDGKVIAEHWADASSPSMWNAPSSQRLVSKMPQNSDNVNTGTYELFRITFQPHVRVNRPNGWEEPKPSPFSGQNPGLPKNFPTLLPWSTAAPTPVSNSLIGQTAQTRG